MSIIDEALESELYNSKDFTTNMLDAWYERKHCIEGAYEYCILLRDVTWGASAGFAVYKNGNYLTRVDLKVGEKKSLDGNMFKIKLESAISPDVKGTIWARKYRKILP